eukprot:4080521-Pyramimonas_sp.AAC.1
MAHSDFAIRRQGSPLQGRELQQELRLSLDRCRPGLVAGRSSAGRCCRSRRARPAGTSRQTARGRTR